MTAANPDCPSCGGEGATDSAGHPESCPCTRGYRVSWAADPSTSADDEAERRGAHEMEMGRG